MVEQETKLIEDAASKLLNDLLSPIDMKAIVSLDERSNRLLIGGQPVEQPRLQNLRQEAELFANSDLWRLLYETPKALAERAMFVHGETLDDLKKGRSILYTLATQKKILDTFRSVIPTKDMKKK